jgi:Ankyrin repeats (many copies)
MRRRETYLLGGIFLFCGLGGFGGGLIGAYFFLTYLNFWNENNISPSELRKLQERLRELEGQLTPSSVCYDFTTVCHDFENFPRQIDSLKKSITKLEEKIPTSKKPMEFVLQSDPKSQIDALNSKTFISQNSQNLMSAPKQVTLSKLKELQLQDELITACEQGDVKAARALLKKGAKPDAANSAGKQPLGAAVWGMNPKVVDELLKQMGGVAPMTWEECEKHNMKQYEEVFIVPKFDPKTFGEWHDLLKKIDPNPFIRAYHLQKSHEQWHGGNRPTNWENLNTWAENAGRRTAGLDKGISSVIVACTETGFVSYRTQIKQRIETTSVRDGSAAFTSR